MTERLGLHGQPEHNSSASFPPDQQVRNEIREDLESNLLVEAGAGSGKTRSLVERMVALVHGRHCKVEEIAAVTFTRKAAAELRQRFQVALECRARRSRDQEERDALDEAVQNLDAAFLGTIHSFCAKMLRERPLEAGLDPGFREMREAEAREMQKAFWAGFLERLAAAGDRRLKELDDLGLAPNQLWNLFETLVENPDVDFGSTLVDPPDADEIEAVRTELDKLLDRAVALMPAREPLRGWDSFAGRVRTLLYWRSAQGWDSRIVFFDALARVYQKKCRPTQNRWLDGPAIKALAAKFEEFAGKGSRACRLVESWWAHRYPFAVQFAAAAAREFAQERKDAGTLTYQDDLMLAAELLRENPSVRRDLGRRYKRLLVDEFQDTDPLQAEILFLLASDPQPAAEAASGAEWLRVVPRPGALFVVGDPKQSIYRFRRADIALYELVKKRFEAFGRVVGLEANFRSLKCIEDVVAGVFDDEKMFPAHAVENQAAFAPLRAQRDPAKHGRGQAACYGTQGRNQAEVVSDEAQLVASHIARRIESGEREAGDFMILTRTRQHLPVYARALEQRSVPVEVSGAGAAADFADKLSAFVLLFKCLADPEHSVHVLGVLTGPFWGIGLADLADYRNQQKKRESGEDGPTPRETGDPPEDGSGDARQPAGRRYRSWFAINRPPPDWTSGPVTEALSTLHGWWRRARKEPADMTAERLADATAVFPLAAAGDLGQLRAGSLVYLLDAIRARVLEGDASLTGAVHAMEAALNWEDAEISLVPGRGKAVRVMNLHQAKGLEAKVVFLATPFGERDHPPSMHVSRDRDGVPRGSMPVVQGCGFRQEIIARPLSWEDDEKVEMTFAKAEKTRLLYVAATRAQDELWVGRCSGPSRNGGSPWEAVQTWIRQAVPADAGAATWVEEMPRSEPPFRAAFGGDADLASREDAAKTAVKDAGEASYVVETVTRRAKTEDVGVDSAPVRESAFAATDLRPLKGGYDWGGVVHHVLMAAGSGESGERLRQRARHLLVEHGRPLDEHGEPIELDTLMEVTAGVRSSEIWRRAMASPERYTEIPIAACRPPSDRLPTRAAGSPALAEVLEGVVDLVFRDGDAWVVADYKTDTGDDPDFPKRLPAYRAQVDLYAECWERITGEPVRERWLVFVARGRAETWQAHAGPGTIGT